MPTPNANRMAALRSKMAEDGLDLVALGPGSYMRWLVGFTTMADERPCLLLVGPDREAILMPALNAEEARQKTDIDLIEWADEDGPDAALDMALAKSGATAAKTVALDETMRTDYSLLLLDHLPGAGHAFAEKSLGAIRMRKDNDEYGLLKQNALIADKAMQTAFAAIRPGRTETEIADALRERFSAEGAAPAFSIVAAGPNAAMPHYHTGTREIGENDAVLLDIGGRLGGYPSDITRMAVLGSGPEGYDEVHAVVEEAVQAALAAARPGVLARAVDAAARDVIAKAGYGAYFVHRTGHGLGMQGHEPPYITATSDTVLDENMVFSIEPGIYLPGRFGVRLEEIVILRKAGPEILSELPRAAHRISV